MATNSGGIDMGESKTGWVIIMFILFILLMLSISVIA